LRYLPSKYKYLSVQQSALDIPNLRALADRYILTSCTLLYWLVLHWPPLWVRIPPDMA
jgi:hypothetical protein